VSDAFHYRSFYLSVHGLKESGSEIELQYSVPDGWDRFGDVSVSTSGDLFLVSEMFKYSAFHFWDTNSLQWFFLILRQKRRRIWSGIWKQESLRVSVVEHIPDCTEISARRSNLSEKEKLSLMLSSINHTSSDVEVGWFGNFVQRLYWQHPIGKWWISVVVKKGIVSDQRADIVYISWHTPKAD